MLYKDIEKVFKSNKFKKVISDSKTSFLDEKYFAEKEVHTPKMSD